MLSVNTYPSFNDLPHGYKHLFEEAASRSFYYSLPWFKNLAENILGDDDKIRIYGVETTNPARTPVAALAMWHKSPLKKTFQTSRLSGLSNYYSSLFGPVLDASWSDISETLQELARAIGSDNPLWDVIDLHPLDVDSPLFQRLAQSLQSTGMIVEPYFCFGNWYLPVNGRSYREYVTTLPSVVKNTIARKSRKLEKIGRIRIEIATNVHDLRNATEAYNRVYKASWKAQEPHPFFMPRLIQICAEMGWLRLGLVYVNEEPAAAQLWIVNGEVASIYKLAYDERFAHLSVGTILTARLMEYVLDVDKVREVDYLTGDDSYKKEWMSHRRERWGIMAFNPRTINGILCIARHVGGRTLKHVLRNVCVRRQKSN